MGPTLIFIAIIVIFLCLLFFFTHITGALTPYSPPELEPITPLPNAIWGWPTFDANGNYIRDANGDIVFDPTLDSVPVTGINGECRSLVWRATSQYTPGFPLVREIESCVEGGVPNCERYPKEIMGCVDSDTLDVQQRRRMCRGVIAFGIRNTGTCIL